MRINEGQIRQKEEEDEEGDELQVHEKEMTREDGGMGEVWDDNERRSRIVQLGKEYSQQTGGTKADVHR